jgi:molybdenum cofactor cytidylyltransferase
MSTFAIIPAAGRSRRMGRPKLLLPWGDGTLMDHVLTIWRASRVGRVVVVLHRDDGELIDLCRRRQVEMVVPDVPPPEMKDSVAAAITFIRDAHRPTDADAWLMAPADMPGLSIAVIHRLVAAHDPNRPRILVPTHAGRRGHPVLFPWPAAHEVLQLAPHEGVNQLLHRHAVEELLCSADALPGDVDTPLDYVEWQQRT